MKLTEKYADFIDGLREAARHSGDVLLLLHILDEALCIEETGHREIVGSEEDIQYLKAAVLAAGFAIRDAEKVSRPKTGNS